jgi:hypothetical protein
MSKDADSFGVRPRGTSKWDPGEDRLCGLHNAVNVASFYAPRLYFVCEGMTPCQHSYNGEPLHDDGSASESV